MRARRLMLIGGVATVAAVAVGAALMEGGAASGDQSACATEFTQGITGLPGGLTVGRDGNVWLAEQVGDRLGRLDEATGRVTEFELPEGTEPHALVTAPDGKLWWTGLGDNVGSFDPQTEEIELYERPEGSRPHNLFFGENGHLYFSEQERGVLSELDPATGEITVYDRGLPEGNRMHDVIIGPDGHLWAALQGTGQIARFNLETQRFDQFASFAPDSGPHDLVATEDGTFYTTLAGTSEIGEWNMHTGKLRTYPTGLAPSRVPDEQPTPKLVDLIFDPQDENIIWVTTFGGDRLLRFDRRTGQVQNMNCGITPGFATLVIIRGPDNRLWFSESLGSSIARLDP